MTTVHYLGLVNISIAYFVQNEQQKKEAIMQALINQNVNKAKWAKYKFEFTLVL